MGLAQVAVRQCRHVCFDAEGSMAVPPLAIEQAAKVGQGQLQGILPLLIQGLQGELLLSPHLGGRQSGRSDHLLQPLQQGHGIRGHATQGQHHGILPGNRRKRGPARLQRFRQSHGVLMDRSPLNGAGQQVGLSPLPWRIGGAAPGNPPAQGHDPHVGTLLNQQFYALMTVMQVKTHFRLSLLKQN